MALLLTAVGCSPATPTSSPAASPGTTAPPATATVKFQVSHNQAETHYTQAILKEVAEKISKETNGAVQMEPFASSQLGSIPDLLDQLMAGTDVVTLANSGQVAEQGGVPPVAAMSSMYVWVPPEGQGGPKAILPLMQKFLASDVWSGWNAELSAKGLHVLSANWYLGERETYGDKAQGYPKPDDLKGVTLRIPDGITWQAYFDQTPVTSVVMDGSEVYTAMSQGTINGSEGPFSQMIGWSLPELTKSVTLTGHGNDTQFFVMGDATWNKLTPEQQAIVTGAFEWGGDKFAQQTLAQFDTDRKMLEDLGINFVDADVPAYAALAEKAYSVEAFPQWGDARQKIQEVYGKS